MAMESKFKLLLVFAAIWSTGEGFLPPVSFAPLVTTYFGQMPGNYFYFCSLHDAVETHKLTLKATLAANVRVLSSKPSSDDFKAEVKQPQRMGIFLDLSCKEGYEFLKNSSAFMNSTYRWMMWSDNLNETLEALTNSRVEADSDVIIVVEKPITPKAPSQNAELSEGNSGYILKRISRIHFQSDHFDIVEIPTPVVPPLEGYLPKNFQGYVFSTSLQMAELEFNKTDVVGPLLDRAYVSGADNMRRCGLSVFMHIAELYNFTMTYLVGHVWGDPLKNGSWTGMIGQVQRGESEFGATLAKFTHERYSVIDFATSFHIANVNFLFLQPKLFGTYKALLLPLRANVWIVFGACAIVSIFILRLVSKYDKTLAHNDGWGGSSFLVISAISNQGIPDTSEHLATRLVYLVVLIVNFIVGIYYNTSILNGLLLPAPNAIQNLDQLLKSDIKLVLQDITYIRREMTHNDSITLRMREKLPKSEENHYLNTVDGVAKLREGQYAFYIEGLSAYHELEKTMTDAQKCSLSEVEKFNPFHIGYVLRKNCPYKEHLNRGLQLMRERGVMSRMKRIWFHRKPDCHWKQDALSLGSEPLFLAYVCMSLGFLLCIFIYLLEKINYKLNSRTF